MKEFEEWWNKEVRPYIYNPKDKDVAKAGWKAALEWVLSIDSGFCSCGCPNDSCENESVLAKINEELEE